MSIQIFITGGTFDKEYNEISGKLYFKKTHLKEMLVMGRSQLDVKIKTLMMIDSLDMSQDDRIQILKSIYEEEFQRAAAEDASSTPLKLTQNISYLRY